MKFQIRIPRFVTSTVESNPRSQYPVLDGSDVHIPNRWKLPPHTVALVGRPAVWSLIDIETPRIPLLFAAIPSQRWHFEQDFGGHLFIIVTSADGRHASVIESGPANPNGTGALVPFCYPEDDFITHGVLDFEPLVVEPPHGFDRIFFAELVRATQRDYDGNQRYLAVEIPFFRVGRDSNSYAVGVLIGCGVDPRSIPRPPRTARYEWTGYPGIEDPVHRANFGAYLGAPSALGEGIVEVAYHNADGSVRYAVVGGEPYGRARLPGGTQVALDRHGRISFSPSDALRHRLPTTHTDPPEQIRDRVRFPETPSTAGAPITLVIDGISVPLAAGNTYTGTVVARSEALGLATMRSNDASEIVLPLAELGVELRDPKRVDTLLRVGTQVTLGLHRDRHPRLVAHRRGPLRDRLGPRRFHAPRPVDIMRVLACASGALLLLFAIAQRMPRR